MYIIIIIKSTSASIISLKYMPKWKKVLNVSSLMSNKYARSELIQYKIYAIRTKYYLLFDLSDISEIWNLVTATKAGMKVQSLYATSAKKL